MHNKSELPRGRVPTDAMGQNSSSDLLAGAFPGDAQFILWLLGAYHWAHMLRSLPDLPDQLLFEQLGARKQLIFGFLLERENRWRNAPLATVPGFGERRGLVPIGSFPWRKLLSW